MSCLINYISLSNQIKSIDISDISKDACKRGKNLEVHKDDYTLCINTCSKNQKTEERLSVFEDKYIVNFEGYIDNLDELKKKLYKNNLRVQTNKIALDAYLKWGSKAPNFMIGSYNFVIINKQNRKIFCARDHLGKKPFFYFYNGEIFVSGSEPKFIFKFNCLKKELNDAYLENFILQNKNCSSESYFKNIQKLKKAESLEITRDGFHRFCYFEFKNHKQYKDATIEETSQIFLDTFKEIIDQQLNNSNEFATHLSGGLDSSSVAMMLSHLNPDKRIDSYTYDFVMAKTNDKFKVDEKKYALDVINKGRFNPHFIRLEYDGIFERLINDQSLFPEPITHFNRYLELAVIKKCKEDNIDTVFTGFDGDTVVSYGQELIQKKFSENKIFEAISLYKKSMKNTQKKAKPIKLFTRYYLLKNLPQSLHMLYKKTKGIGRFYHHHSLLSEDLKSNINYTELLSKQRELQYDYKNGHEKLLNSNLYTQYFEAVDTDYSYNGIEEKHPFCDVRLMNLSLNIPLEHKFKNGVSRYLLRHSMKHLLPSSVTNRYTKSNLSPYFFYVLDEKINEIIEILIHSQSKVSLLLSKANLKNMKNNLKSITPQEKNLLVKYALMNSWLESNFN